MFGLLVLPLIVVFALVGLYIRVCGAIAGWTATQLIRSAFVAWPLGLSVVAAFGLWACGAHLAEVPGVYQDMAALVLVLVFGLLLDRRARLDLPRGFILFVPLCRAVWARWVWALILRERRFP